MEKLVVGQKCMISNELELVLSFKRANLEWKKKYKKFLGQPAQVLALFGDNTVMLKFGSGNVFKFPIDCVKRYGCDFIHKLQQ